MRLPLIVFLVVLSGSTTANAKDAKGGGLEELLSRIGSKPAPKIPVSPNGTIELGEIDDDSVQDTIAKLDAVKKAGAKTAYIRINSPGGSVPAGQLLDQHIESLGIPVVCIGDSNVESMAFYILQGCTERWATKRTVFMIHPPSFSGVSGNPLSLETTAQELQVMADAMAEHEAARLKISVEVLKSKIDTHAWFFNWNEAVEIGAVDKIVAPKDIPADIEWN